MKKLNEMLLAILSIIVYIASIYTVRDNFGDDSPVLTAALAVIAVVIVIYIKSCHLEERYGLCKWKGKAGTYLFFIPMLILMTGNLWGGIGMAYEVPGQVCAVVSMLLVGFAEEMIFRGFLFRILLKKDPVPVAIIISAVTFGIGHIINLFSGQPTVDSVVQVFFAIAWGFIFTFVFYKSGSLIMCVIAHGLTDAFSKFRAADIDVIVDYVYMGAVIVGALIYCAYLSRKPAALEKE